MSNYKVLVHSVFLIAILVVIFPGSSYCQTDLKEIYSKVEKKLQQDSTYLNLYKLPFSAKDISLTGLTNIPKYGKKDLFNFKSTEGYSYEIEILKPNSEIDSLVVLRVIQIFDKASTGQVGIFENAGEAAPPEVTDALTFSDINELYFEHHEIYLKLYELTEQLLDDNDNEGDATFRIKIDDKVNKSRGISSVNNQDYYNFLKVNSIHRIPSLSVEKKTSSLRRAVATDVVPFQIDASFSHLTFFNPILGQNMVSFSPEINLGAKVLNVHPFQAMSISFGGRFLISVSSKVQNILDDFIIDGKIMLRVPVNFSSIASNLFSQKPKLNLNSGIIFDISTSRAYGLPFINFYAAIGSKIMANPKIRLIDKNGNDVAYYTSSQYEGSMSFYWNSDEDLTVRFRMDIGFGNFNVMKKNYSTNNLAQVHNTTQPKVKFYINFSPQKKDYFGMYTGLFDNELTLGGWVGIPEIFPSQTFRVEINYITTPFFRSIRDWENEEGSFYIQLRYRYGL